MLGPLPPLRRKPWRVALLAGACCAALAIAGCGGGSAATTSTAATKRAGHAEIAVKARQVPTLVVPPDAPPRVVHVPIITYHRVHLYATELTKSIPDLTVEPSVFAAEMSALATGGYHTISQAQLFAALYHGAALPAKPVLVTVDDGYVDDVTQILPVLLRLHMIATFYVITGRIHEPGFLSADQIRELDRAGMDVGDHTVSHADLPALSDAELVAQVAGSRAALERILGHTVQLFAYPFGAYDDRVVAEVRRAGYVLAVTTRGGTTESSLDPLTMPRIHIGRAATPASVLACVSAATTCGGGGGG